jgi:hypothetical protein
MTSQIAAAIHVLGFSAGSLLYAMLLAMVAREFRPFSQRENVESSYASRDHVLVGTAIAGLIWNLGALLSYGLLDVGIEPPRILQVASFSALGFLPAAVVQSVVRQGLPGRLRKTAATLGYGIASAATVLQIRAMLEGAPVPSVPALRVLTFGFLTLMPLLLALTRAQPGARRAGWIVALAVFAVSAFHLAQHHLYDSWWLELAGHHASLPLVLALLYQDYPFALADLFLKQALAVVGLGTLVLGAWSLVVLLVPENRIATSAVLLGAWTATALSYPFVQRVSARLVDVVLLHRPDYEELRARINRVLATTDDEAGVLATACDLLRSPLNAHRVESRALAAPPFGASTTLVEIGPRRTDAKVFVPAAEPPYYLLEIGEIAGGRRLLSDDVAFLEHVAFVVARRIDVVRFTRERFASQLREEEAERRTIEARLDALRAQIHPHFLFNALNTVGHLIQDAPSRAIDTLLKLTDVLRRVLRADTPVTPLREELALIRAYLEIEQARFEERLLVEIDVPETLLTIPVPPLVLQPLVENAVKHGIAPLARGGAVTVRARQVDTMDGPQRLELVVIDTGRGPLGTSGRSHGTGLANLERRLTLAFGSLASVALLREDGRTMARVVLPLTGQAEAQTSAALPTG